MYKEMEPLTERLPRPHLGIMHASLWQASLQPKPEGAAGGFSSAPPPFSSPGSSFAFSSFSFPSVGLVSGPDPVQYLSPGSAICSHFHMFNIHISCLLPCPIAVTGSFSFHLSPRAIGHLSFVAFLSLIPPGEYWELQPRAVTVPTPHLYLQPLPHTLTWWTHTWSSSL